MAWHRLARERGSTVEEIQERMSSAEFTEYLAFSMQEPAGAEMDNWRAAMIAAAVVNAVRSTVPLPKGKPRPKPLQVSDFMPNTKRKKVTLTKEQQEHIRKKRAKKNG